MAIVLRGTKGTALTYNEADENWDFLERTKHNRLDPSYEGVYPNAKITVDANGEIVVVESGGELTPGVYENPIITVDDAGLISDIASATGNLPPGEYANPLITIGETGFISNISTVAGDLPPGTYQNAIITIGANGFITNVEAGEDVKIIDSFVFTGNTITTVDSSDIRLDQRVVIDGGNLRVKNSIRVDGDITISNGLELENTTIRTVDSSPVTIDQETHITGNLVVDNELYCDDIRTSARWFKLSETSSGKSTGGDRTWVQWTNRGLVHQDSEFFRFDSDDRLSVYINQDGLYRINASVTLKFTTTTGFNLNSIQLQLYERNTNELISRTFGVVGRGETFMTLNLNTIHRCDRKDVLALRLSSSSADYQTTSTGEWSMEYAGYSSS